MKLQPKNWATFQHYKDRNPPWIKLHKNILDKPDYMSLSLASFGLASMLWLLASETKDGVFDASIEHLTFRLRKSDSEISECVKLLIDKGFFIIASTVIADDTESCSEGETETEAYKEETEGEQKSENQLTQLINLIKPEFKTLTPAQLGAAKDWLKKGKTLEDLKAALIKTAGSERSATRWGWIVDEMNKDTPEVKPKKGRLRK